MATDDHSAEADAGKGTKRKKFSGKKLVLFIILPVVLVCAAAAGLYVSGIFGPKKPDKKAEAAVVPPTYYDLPSMLVNLSTSGNKPTFLKLSVALELANATDKKPLEEVMPRIIDNFQVYMRELRVSDLKGSAGLYRLREELLQRVNQAVEPVKVRDVLFREMLVQ